jgi:hypothetical protein
MGTFFEDPPDFASLAHGDYHHLPSESIFRKAGHEVGVMGTINYRFG